MVYGNRIALEEIVAQVQNNLLCVEILAESIEKHQNDVNDIAWLILGQLQEARQFLGDVDTLISCELKNIEIDK